MALSSQALPRSTPWCVLHCLVLLCCFLTAHHPAAACYLLLLPPHHGTCIWANPSNDETLVLFA